MVDIFFGVLFLYLIFVGIYRGFIEIFLKVIGFGAGIWISFRYFPYLSSFLDDYFHTEKIILDLLSFLIIFFPFLGLTIWLNVYIHKHVKRKKKLSIFNKILGGIFLTALFFSFIVFLNYIALNNRTLKDILNHSKIAQILNFFQ